MLQHHQKEPALSFRTHGNESLTLCVWMVEQQLDRMEWENNLPANSEESDHRYGTEPGNLWNSQPFLPLTQLEKIEE